MKTRVNRKYINAGFTIGILILLFINLIMYLNIQERRDDDKYINKSLKIISLSDKLHTVISDAESSRRGYLLTGNREFIDQYNRSAAKIDSLFQRIKLLTSYNSEYSVINDSISYLLSVRRYLLKETFETPVLDSARIEFINSGSQVLQKINSLTNQLTAKENEVLAGRNEDASLRNDNLLLQIFAGALISFIIIITGIIIFNVDLRWMRESRKMLAQNKNWLYTSLKSIGDGVIVTNHIGDITFMNALAQKLTGWKEDEAKGIYHEHVFKLVKAETWESVENPITKVFRTGKITGLTGDNLLVKKDGGEIPIDDSAAPIISDDGSMLGVILVFRDVTSARKTEMEIQKNQRFIQQITESIPNILYVCGIKEPGFVYVNEKIKNNLGYNPDEVIKMGNAFFEKTIHPEDYGRLLAHRKELTAESDSKIIESEYRMKNSKGEWRWMHSYDVVFSRDNRGFPVRILGTAVDITEKKQLEEQIRSYNLHLEEVVERRTSEQYLTNKKLQQEIIERLKAEKNITEAEDKFRSLVEYSLVGIYIIQDGKFIYTNPKFEEIFKYGTGELTDRECLSVVHPKYTSLVSENMKKRLERVIEDSQYSFKGVRKDGTIIDVEVRGTTMFYDGRISIIGTLQDITERKKAEDRTAESLKEKELLLQEIHHRVKNNLQIVVSLLKLQSRYVHDRRDLELFNKSRARIETMSLIHEKLYKSADLSNINIGNYLRDLSTNLLKAYGVNLPHIILGVSGDDVNAGIDTVIPCGLIVNELVANSLKHAFPGGRSGSIKIYIKKNGENINLTFCDDGAGLPEDFVIEKSSSLGLQIVSTLVKQLGGEINFKSSDSGTVFSMSFPELKEKDKKNF